MKPFESAQAPLQPGFTLIEASAGTGKTTTIIVIALRLIVEEGLPIEKILITTYTELATAELRKRLRETLTEGLSAAQTGRRDESLVSQIVQRVEQTVALQRLRSALAWFDDAAIYTIHGFCARILSDRAFESGELFETETVAEQTGLLREIAQDFLRENLYPASAFASAVAAGGGVKIDELVRLLDEITNNPTIEISPQEPSSLVELARDLDSHWEEVRECWRKSADAVRTKFSNLRWAKGNHKKPEMVEAMLAMMSSHCDERGGGGDLAAGVEFFSAGKIRAATRAGERSPEHEFFNRCEELSVRAQRFAIALKVHFCAWARDELQQRKGEQQSFSDLLTSLDAALHGADGAALRETLRDRYPVALIDEFQDTDPVQYSIFSQIYAGSDAKVFLIGDPKQAIYGFRGADVFTYLRARRDAAVEFSLPQNWRSEKKLVSAVNEIFGAREQAFVLDRIDFKRMAASGRAEAKAFAWNDRPDQPLRLWVAKDPGQIEPAIAAEIARLLNGDAKIGDEPVKPRHIAVLVHKNAQPREIQRVLSRLGIPSVVYSAANVFHSEEAKELQRVLLAIAVPAGERRLRAALLTSAVGLDANELAALSDTEWEKRANAFADYHQLWRDEGFVKMLRAFLVGEGVRARLLRLVDGERRLTNWLHLGELLHRACAENRFGIDGVITWLERQIAAQTVTREEYELRLESDDDAVRLVTIHKSKGLQYPITFCPFAWQSPTQSKGAAKFHVNDRVVLDLTRAKEHDEARRIERLAEMVRQFYVALTRAEHRGYCIWLEAEKQAKSAPAWIFSAMRAADFVKSGIQANAVTLRLREKFLGSADIAVEPIPEQTATRVAASDGVRGKFSVRKLGQPIDRSWGISSFTSLVSGRRGEVEEEDIDAIDAVEEIEEPEIAAEGIHAFPRGARSGSCLHRILEEIDFAEEANVRATAEEWLAKFNIAGFDRIIAETICATLTRELPGAGIALQQLSRRQRVSELHFTFPLRELTLAKLAKLFSGAPIPLAIDRLQFLPTRGFMKGSIDLVFQNGARFFIVDWKSNWLGPSETSYAAENVAAEMHRNFYTVQLNLYALALHRYLVRRLPGYDYEKNFGGVFYIFLRGIEGAARGIFSERPSREFIENLDRVLHGNA